MTLKEQIKNDTINAMKEKNEELVGALRMLSAAITNREIELKKREEGLSDEEVIEVAAKEANKRKDAIELYIKGSRQDLADKETSELKILETYLPAQLSDEEIEKEVKSAIKETRASSMKDLGKVMSAAMPRLKGKADGAKVSEIVKRALQSST